MFMLGISVNRHGNIQSKKIHKTATTGQGDKARVRDELNEQIGPLHARPGHMVRNKLCWDANNAAGLPKQKDSYQSSPTFLCFESATALFASQHKKTSFRFISNIFVQLICVSSRTLM